MFFFGIWLFSYWVLFAYLLLEGLIVGLEVKKFLTLHSLSRVISLCRWLNPVGRLVYYLRKRTKMVDLFVDYFNVVWEVCNSVPAPVWAGVPVLGWLAKRGVQKFRAYKNGRSTDPRTNLYQSLQACLDEPLWTLEVGVKNSAALVCPSKSLRITLEEDASKPSDRTSMSVSHIILESTSIGEALYPKHYSKISKKSLKLYKMMNADRIVKHELVKEKNAEAIAAAALQRINKT